MMTALDQNNCQLDLLTQGPRRVKSSAVSSILKIFTRRLEIILLMSKGNYGLNIISIRVLVVDLQTKNKRNLN